MGELNKKQRNRCRRARAGKSKVTSWNRFLMSAAATVAASAIAIMSAEVYLRWKQSGSIPEYSPAVYTHRGQRLSVREGGLKLSLAPFTLYKNLPSQHTSAFNINSKGLRSDENAEQSQSPKIIFLGGSAAFGQGARTDQETIEYALERSMSSYRVLNAGVVGFLSGQELTYLVTELVDYDPAVVVAYNGWNDLFDAVYYPGRNSDELGFNSNFFAMEDRLVVDYQMQVSLYKSLIRVTEATANRSLLYERIVQRLGAFRQRGRSANHDLLDAAALTYAKNVRKMALFSRSCGARFIVIFQPELGQKPHPTPDEQKMLDSGIAGTADYHSEFTALYRQFLAKAKQLLTKDGVEWLDINESTKYLESTEELFIDVVHTNRRGNELVAEIIAERLRYLADGNSEPARRARCPL